MESKDFERYKLFIMSLVLDPGFKLDFFGSGKPLQHASGYAQKAEEMLRAETESYVDTFLFIEKMLTFW